MHGKQGLRVLFSLAFVLALAATGLGTSRNALKFGRRGLGPRAEAAQQYCTTDQISTMDVGSCDCRPKSNGCDPKPCTFCSLPATNKSIKSCSGGCTDDEAECEGCGIWFYQLCNCLKDGLKDPSECKTSAKIEKSVSPRWALLETSAEKDNLVTTTELVPGFLEMTKAPSKFDPGWVFAQKHYDPKTEALAINSVRTRTHAQIHIHVCQRNETTSKWFDDQTAPSGHLAQLTNNKDFYCLALTNSAMATSFATSLSDFLTTSGVCAERVGAGIIQDSHGNTWACATTFTFGPLPYFCEKPN